MRHRAIVLAAAFAALASPAAADTAPATGNSDRGQQVDCPVPAFPQRSNVVHLGPITSSQQQQNLRNVINDKSAMTFTLHCGNRIVSATYSSTEGISATSESTGAETALETAVSGAETSATGNFW